jgi:hypothetical protein
MFRNANGSFTVRHTYRRNYCTHELVLFTVMPGDKYTLGEAAGHIHMEAVRERLIEMTSLHPKRDDQQFWARWGNPYALHPESLQEPKVPKLTVVEHPTWAAKGEYGYDRYVAGIKKHGTLEKWHEAYHRYSKRRDAANSERERWVRGSRVSIFEGMVLDANGVVSQRSLEREKQRIRRECREREAERKRWQEEQRKLKERHEKERIKREKEQAKQLRAATADLRKRSKAIAAALDAMPARSVQYIVDRKLVVNDDATVKLVKAVDPGTYTSRHGATYKPETTVTAPDYRDHNSCGHGLHFSPTLSEARTWANPLAVGVECHVDMTTLVMLDNSKVKAKFCHVKQELTDDQACQLHYAFLDPQDPDYTPPAVAIGKWSIVK